MYLALYPRLEYLPDGAAHGDLIHLQACLYRFGDLRQRRVKTSRPSWVLSRAALGAGSESTSGTLEAASSMMRRTVGTSAEESAVMVASMRRVG